MRLIVRQGAERGWGIKINGKPCLAQARGGRRVASKLFLREEWGGWEKQESLCRRSSRERFRGPSHQSAISLPPATPDKYNLGPALFIAKKTKTKPKQKNPTGLLWKQLQEKSSSPNLTRSLPEPPSFKQNP